MRPRTAIRAVASLKTRVRIRPESKRHIAHRHVFGEARNGEHEERRGGRGERIMRTGQEARVSAVVFAGHSVGPTNDRVVRLNIEGTHEVVQAGVSFRRPLIRADDRLAASRRVVPRGISDSERRARARSQGTWQLGNVTSQ